MVFINTKKYSLKFIIFPTKKVDSPNTPLSIYLFKVNNRNT